MNSEKKEISVNYISSQMMDKNSNGSRLVDKLVKKGWARKQESLNDKRTIKVEITESGIQHLEIVYKIILTEYLTKISKAITPEETKAINSLLNRMLDN